MAGLQALSRRLEAALDAAALSRIEGVAGIPGNPLAVESRSFGALTATVVRQPALYYGYYNAIRGLAGKDPEASLGDALAWCREEGCSPRLTTSPYIASPELLGALQDSGLRASGAMSLLCGPARSLLPASAAVAVELPAGRRGRMERLWPGDDTAEDRAWLISLCRAEFVDWRVYAALEGGVALAYACLYIDGGVGVLASAFTRPEARRRGLQSALLARRIADADAAGCDLVVSTAAPGSQSERNLRRAGLTHGYTQTIWQ